jgi:hypothetical protein
VASLQECLQLCSCEGADEEGIVTHLFSYDASRSVFERFCVAIIAFRELKAYPGPLQIRNSGDSCWLAGLKARPRRKGLRMQWRYNGVQRVLKWLFVSTKWLFNPVMAGKHKPAITRSASFSAALAKETGCNEDRHPHAVIHLEHATAHITSQHPVSSVAAVHVHRYKLSGTMHSNMAPKQYAFIFRFAGS